jgi:hypothetical protein
MQLLPYHYLDNVRLLHLGIEFAKDKAFSSRFDKDREPIKTSL